MPAASPRPDVLIYHNPRCSTSRKALALLEEAGLSPTVVEYLKTPPTRETLVELAARMGVALHGLLRQKEKAYAELSLGRPGTTNDEILDALAAHPILLERPIVVTPLGARLGRPPEAVLEILPPTRK